MSKYTALPTWVLNEFLPESHPFHGISLQRWHDGRTNLCRYFDAIFWALIASLAILLFTA